MNLSSRSIRLLVASGLLGVGLLCAPSLVQAQQLPDNVRTAADAGPFRVQIAEFVNTQAARMKSGVPAELQGARDTLITAVAGQPSISFNELYADAINTAMQPLLKETKVAVRLNVAIVVTRVAERTNSARLAPVVKVLLADESPGVVIWSMRAAKPLVLSILSDPILASNNLVPAIVDAARKNINSGPVAAEAYNALTATLLDRTARAAFTTPQLQKLVPAIIDAVQIILAERLKLYETGLPPEASIDGPRATLFLLDTQNWQLASEKQRVKTAELSLWAGVLAARRQSQKEYAARRMELLEVVRYQGRSLVLLADFAQSAALKTAAEDMARVTNFSPAEQVLQSASDVPEAMLSVPLFKSVQPPPDLPSPPAANSQPASGG